MIHKNLDREIQSRISSFISELSFLVKQSAVESVQEALGGTVPPGRGPGRPRTLTMTKSSRPGRVATRAKRSSADVEAVAARVLAQIRSKEGQRLEEIGRALKTPTTFLKLPIARLMAAKKLKTKGQKRGTKYFVK